MAAHPPRRSARGALAALLVVAGGALTACSDESDNALAPFSPVEVPDIRGPEDLDDAYTGVLDSVLYEDLDAWEGIEMTLLAEVVDVASPRAFTVTSPEEEVEPILVVTTADAGADPSPGDQVVLAVTAVDGFAPQVVAEELDLDLAPEELEEWGDEIFLVATIVEPAP